MQLDVDIATHIQVKEDGLKRRFATCDLLVMYYQHFMFYLLSPPAHHHPVGRS